MRVLLLVSLLVGCDAPEPSCETVQSRRDSAEQRADLSRVCCVPSRPCPQMP